MSEQHVVPVNDLVDHEVEDCICGPRTECVERPDGSIGFVVVHHSLDGRERWDRMARLYRWLRRNHGA
jgi:hypothetical protein